VARQTGDRRRCGAFAADVADRDGPRAVTGLEGVVEVPADLRALAGGVIDRGDLGVRDVGERRRQKRALKRARDLISVLVEAGGVDGGCGSPGELDREREVRLVVAPVGARGGERDNAVADRSPSSSSALWRTASSAPTSESARASLASSGMPDWATRADARAWSPSDAPPSVSTSRAMLGSLCAASPAAGPPITSMRHQSATHGTSSFARLPSAEW
jgi:hypothetical protein